MLKVSQLVKENPNNYVIIDWTYLKYWKGISSSSSKWKAILNILEISLATAALSRVLLRLTLPISAQLCQLSPSRSSWNGKDVTLLKWHAYYIFGDNFWFPLCRSCWRSSSLLRRWEIWLWIFHVPFMGLPEVMEKGGWQLNTGCRWLFTREQWMTFVLTPIAKL